jgi:adenosylmethionine-8-amino-7-oxononanoate aminotransferase
MFALEHTNIIPDIICLGKAITGGYMTFAATITNEEIAKTISETEAKVFMHGPTFMANPLAANVAVASIKLLLSSPWKSRILNIEKQLKKELSRCASLGCVNDVRILGAIGVVETKYSVNLPIIQKLFVENNVWIRPFGNLIYLMPPYIINENELGQLTSSIYKILRNHEKEIFIL